jgi:Skp family chaperone for outer membrane proteins
MDKASEVLFALKPVSYRFKKEIDSTQSPAFGLIAEEVAEVNPDLVARNAQGQPESVHYEMVNAMLLNEFLKEHRMVQEQQKEIVALKKELKEQKAFIQRVSACIELSKSSTRTTANDP